ncbi:DUF262 domain-containing protein [Serratia ureilytica]|uniref:DUF262 domain-containing protein n=1 Tax=Serratia TaxID=613 RepID=UPI0018E6FF25|nr:DUF262 domain-containing protein [Serratia ureilytica]MBJ2112341.1 DUF262 domain-containing protein [Serratia ureilytica]
MVDMLYEYEEQAENEDDINLTDNINFSSAVVSGTDWTTETIINQINKNNIQLNPDFQRRDAWDKIRKSNFIESLILGLPVPQLVLAERKDKRGAYIVLDGKQRLLSIRQFSAEKNDPLYESLSLSGLDIRPDLKGKNLHEMKNDPLFLDDVSAFENQPIRTIVIKNWPSEEFLYHVFLRLNTGSVMLAPQELRQALHPGPFVTFIDTSSTQSAALKAILKLKKPDFRMRDNELLLRYISFKNFLSEYSGDLKKFLDKTCLIFNRDWSSINNLIDNQVAEFELSHQYVEKIFGDNSYRKWFAGSYEKKFNRAIFDILITTFSTSEVRAKSVGKEAMIEDAFKTLCATNYPFLSSIETTTKSLNATFTRFSTWYTAVNNIIGNELPTLKMDNNRIKVS